MLSWTMRFYKWIGKAEKCNFWNIFLKRFSPVVIDSSLDTESSIVHLYVERKETQKQVCVRPGIEPATFCSSVYRPRAIAQAILNTTSRCSKVVFDWSSSSARVRSAQKSFPLFSAFEWCIKEVPALLRAQNVVSSRWGIPIEKSERSLPYYPHR